MKLIPGRVKLNLGIRNCDSRNGIKPEDQREERERESDAVSRPWSKGGSQKHPPKHPPEQKSSRFPGTGVATKKMEP